MCNNNSFKMVKFKMCIKHLWNTKCAVYKKCKNNNFELSQLSIHMTVLAIFFPRAAPVVSIHRQCCNGLCNVFVICRNLPTSIKVCF